MHLSKGRKNKSECKVKTNRSGSKEKKRRTKKVI
jgi:hypothetical protein